MPNLFPTVNRQNVIYFKISEQNTFSVCRWLRQTKNEIPAFYCFIEKCRPFRTTLPENNKCRHVCFVSCAFLSFPGCSTISINCVTWQWAEIRTYSYMYVILRETHTNEVSESGQKKIKLDVKHATRCMHSYFMVICALVAMTLSDTMHGNPTSSINKFKKIQDKNKIDFCTYIVIFGMICIDRGVFCGCRCCRRRIYHRFIIHFG